MQELNNQGPDVADVDAMVFRKSYALQVELQEVMAAIGNVADQRCLEIGGVNAMFSYQLRRSGGQWHTLTLDANTAERLRESLGTDISVLLPNADPFEKYVFDTVVVTGDVLESRKADADFIRQCHRMLKPEGRLIVCTTRAKRMTLIHPLRRVFMSPGNPGYTESRLFGILKNGFDVSTVRTYQRFFMTAVDVWAGHAARLRMDRPMPERIRTINVAGVLYWFAFQLDALLFMTRGHRMIAVARRRAWRSREAPVLSDGRSISEAVLKPIG